MTILKTIIQGFAAGILICVMSGAAALAQNPGDSCDPDSAQGHAARLDSFSGKVSVYGPDGKPAPLETGSAVPDGATIRTDAAGQAELVIEDGTVERSSRILVVPGSTLAIHGGLYCSDLRPKADGGRWSARQIDIEVQQGQIEVEIAQGVSHSFNLEVSTPNSRAVMLRGSQQVMQAMIRVDGLEDRPKVPLMEHPRIREHVQMLLMGRDPEELNPGQKQGVMSQAATAALSMGLIDLEAMSILDDPQLKPTMAMMTQGRRLDDLSQEERSAVMAMAGAMAINLGLLDPEKIRVHAQPDEYTYVQVRAGKMRLNSRHQGRQRDKTVEIESMMFSEVKGYELPSPPEKIQ